MQEGLVQEVSRLVDTGLAPDLIVITGDIAHSGKKAEYDLARKWIDARLLREVPGVRKQDVLIVPGNHDVDRTRVGAAARSLHGSLVEQRSQPEIAKVLRNRDDRGVMLRRHTAYMRFAAEYGAAARKRGRPSDVPWWSIAIPAKDGRPSVFFAGLCSSWTSHDGDHGKLLLGRWQVNTVFENEPKEVDFKVALIHHPWSFLAEFDSRELQETVFRKVDLVLRGHLHAQRSHTVLDPDNACLELAAGSVYDGSTYANAFQLIELVPGERIARIHYRVWHNEEWIADRNAYRSASDGIAEFPLTHPVPIDRRTASAPPPDPSKFLKRVLSQTETIDIRGLEVGSGQANSLPIDQLYIPLVAVGSRAFGREADDLKETHKKGSHEYEHAAFEDADLREALIHRCLVVVGDPGSGKSTFLRCVALELCRRELGMGVDRIDSEWEHLKDGFPLPISLAELARHFDECRDRREGPKGADAPAWLSHFVGTESAESFEQLDQSFFEERLSQPGTVVLLDGLDEPPDDRLRVRIRKLIERAALAYPECRFIVTTRPAAYQGEVVLQGFEEARIGAISESAIEGFLTSWCYLLCKQDQRKAERHLKELLVPVKQRPEIRRLASNPVMLTALAVVHWNEKRLPEQRADLYESIIKWLSKSRENRPDRPTPDRCVTILQELALAMTDHPDGRQAQVARHWSARAIASSFREVPDESEQIEIADRFLKAEELDSGIIVGRGEHELRFWHLTFQEYLAARAISARESAEIAARLLKTEKLYQQEWREVILLLAGVLHQRGLQPVDGLFAGILDQLGEKPSLVAKARCAALLSAILSDLSPIGYRPGDARYDKILQDVLAVFDRKRSKGMPIEDAIAAAEAIGQAGDPRFANPNSPDLWVTVPAGEFIMGAQSTSESKPNYDSKARSFEGPPHTVRHGEYRIGRYPVTVSQFLAFTGSTAYDLEIHWRSGGFQERRPPDDRERQKETPNHPVTGVTWYEAMAYAHWAGCRLPSEAEWERAARGTIARRYPWGNDEIDSTRANYHRSIYRTTPVGIYPLGETPEGIRDMAGSVWEWCADKWHDGYEGAPADGSARTQGGEEIRVLRGGSWLHLAHYCRSAARYGGRPGGRNSCVGFRVASGTS